MGARWLVGNRMLGAPFSPTPMSRSSARHVGTTADPSFDPSLVRALMDACLAALLRAGLGGAHLFPHGVDDIEIHLTARDSATDARIRVSANSRPSP